MHHLKRLFSSKRRRRREEAQNNAGSLPSRASTSNGQKSRGSSPQIQTQKRDEPSEAWRVAKASLTLALELTEKALDGIPVPGAKGTISLVLRIIKGIDVGFLIFFHRGIS